MEKKIQIIKLLDEKRQGLHIREISRQAKTGLPNVKRYLDILEKEKVIKKQKKGNMINITLLYKPALFPYLRQIHSGKFLELPASVQMAVQDFLKELEQKPVISLLFGSYAKLNYSKDSDIDIFLVFQELRDEKKIEEIAKRISMRSNTKISPIYTEYNEFKKKFMDKNNAFSNEIRNKVIIINGVEYYYELTGEFEK